jgi:hypothetical protein
MRKPDHHDGTPQEFFDVPLIDWLVFVPVAFELQSVPDGEPTPDEIAARAAEVRAGWTAMQLRRAEGEFIRPAAVVHRFPATIFD